VGKIGCGASRDGADVGADAEVDVVDMAFELVFALEGSGAIGTSADEGPLITVHDSMLV